MQFVGTGATLGGGGPAVDARAARLARLSGVCVCVCVCVGAPGVAVRCAAILCCASRNVSSLLLCVVAGSHVSAQLTLLRFHLVLLFNLTVLF